MLTMPAMRNAQNTPVPNRASAEPPRMKTLDAGEIDERVIRMFPPTPSSGRARPRRCRVRRGEWRWVAGRSGP